MNPLLYAANIGTMAAWLSVAGASTVGILVKRSDILPELNQSKLEEIQMTEGPLLDVDLFSSGSPAAAEADSVENDEVLQAPETTTTPEIPEMQEIAETVPLPVIPDFPEVKPKSEPISIPKSDKAIPRPSIKRAEQAKPGSDRPAVTQRSEKGQGSGAGSGSVTGAGSDDTGAARFAGGRKPKPSYPAMAKRQGIEGTVRASITVDESGRVVSASIISASHPALNDRAILGTLNRWRFKPGARATRILPISFTLDK